MGGYNCYCAICAVSMSGVTIRGPPPNMNEDNNDMNDYDDEDDGYGPYGYDPTVLPPENTLWLQDCHVIGINSEVKKAFISGPGTYIDHGMMDCATGDDPNCPVGLDRLQCYESVMPFHWHCYRLLSRRFTGSDDPDSIDKETLFRVMEALSPDYYGTALELDYVRDVVGIEFLSNEQVWGSNPGEELYACSPLPTPQLSSAMWTEFCRPYSMPLLNEAPGAKLKSGCFDNLPAEVADLILLHLDHSDLMAFLQASWITHLKTHSNNAFWKFVIQRQMPWFFELQEFLQHQDSGCVKSMKGLYLWAREATTPRDGLRFPLMFISNRRRIWSVCDQLADRYFSPPGT